MEARNLTSSTNVMPKSPVQKFIDMPEDTRCELINGKIVMMSAPALIHQGICGEVSRQLSNYLAGKPCKTFAGAGVRFSENERKPSVFIPDIVVVCDPTKMQPQWIVGVPDMIIEILSPSNRRHDMVFKMDRYLREGVPEYWIIDPDTQTIMKFILTDGHYCPKFYVGGEKVPVHVLDDCEIDFSTLFAPVEESPGELESE